MGQRPDLVLKAASLHVDDKLGLDEVANAAMEYAEASAKATIRSAPRCTSSLSASTAASRWATSLSRMPPTCGPTSCA
jgi:hypothetical protein